MRYTVDRKIELIPFRHIELTPWELQSLSKKEGGYQSNRDRLLAINYTKNDRRLHITGHLAMGGDMHCKIWSWLILDNG